MKKNLLIGSITNYFWEDVAPFFKSYQRAGFENCDCVMFVGNMSAKTIEKIKSCGVTVYQIPEHFLNGRIVLYRFKLYEEFLQQHIGEYDMVFTADVRDVIFQRDIFKLYESSKPFLLACIESYYLSERRNKKWILDMYGENIYESIKHERVICMGTLLATSNEFLKFLQEENQMLENGPIPYIKMNDQGVLNVMIHHRRLFNDILIKSDNETGYVITGITEAIKFDSENNILNGKGEIAAVVHQYDRHPDIVEKVVNKFCSDIKGLYYDSTLLNRKGIKYSLARIYYKLRKKGFIYALKAAIRKVKRKLSGQKDF